MAIFIQFNEIAAEPGYTGACLLNLAYAPHIQALSSADKSELHFCSEEGWAIARAAITSTEDAQALLSLAGTLQTQAETPLVSLPLSYDDAPVAPAPEGSAQHLFEQLASMSGEVMIMLREQTDGPTEILNNMIRGQNGTGLPLFTPLPIRELAIRLTQAGNIILTLPQPIAV